MKSRINTVFYLVVLPHAYVMTKLASTPFGQERYMLRINNMLNKIAQPVELWSFQARVRVNDEILKVTYVQFNETGDNQNTQ